jgi:hypothetical protein
MRGFTDTQISWRSHKPTLGKQAKERACRVENTQLILTVFNPRLFAAPELLKIICGSDISNFSQLSFVCPYAHPISGHLSQVTSRYSNRVPLEYETRVLTATTQHLL